MSKIKGTIYSSFLSSTSRLYIDTYTPFVKYSTFEDIAFMETSQHGDIKYLKNIAIPSENEYRLKLIMKTENILKRIRWKALAFLGK